MNRYAGQAGCALRLMSPRPRLLEIMRLTNLGRELIVQPCDPADRLACSAQGRSPRRGHGSDP